MSFREFIKWYLAAWVEMITVAEWSMVVKAIFPLVAIISPFFVLAVAEWWLERKTLGLIAMVVTILVGIALFGPLGYESLKENLLK